MPGTVLSMQNIYLVKKNYANLLEGDTKPPEGDNSMKFVYHQLNELGKQKLSVYSSPFIEHVQFEEKIFDSLKNCLI